jgi:hypothetical protein
MNKKTNLEIEKKFWVIARHGEPNGYHTGHLYIDITLFEFDSATELNEFLGDKSVESGESMGDYIFNVLAVSHSEKTLDELAEFEKQELEMIERENQYMEEESKSWSEPTEYECLKGLQRLGSLSKDGEELLKELEPNIEVEE